MTPVSTNLHFHGLSVPPLCHQDEVLRTSIQPGDAPFEYRFRIPLNEPPEGYVQPLDFFGDGTRIPLIVVSPYTRAGHISHEYSDHVSILKFIERNWNLRPVMQRSRDNYRNPVAERGNPYVPLNTPAIADLFDLFDFNGHQHGY